MTDTQTPIVPENQEIKLPLLHRSAMPLFLFGLSLCGFFLLSQEFILPALTSMRLPGQTLKPDEVVPEKKELEALVESLEVKRHERIIGRDPLHTSVRTIKHGDMQIRSLLDGILQVARASSTTGTVQINELSINADAHTIHLTGDVFNAGPGSMTVLASFADALQKLEDMEVLKTSAFRREQNADGSFHSPFDFTLSFNAS